MPKIPNLNAIQERIRQVKLELARLKMAEKLALMASKAPAKSEKVLAERAGIGESAQRENEADAPAE